MSKAKPFSSDTAYVPFSQLSENEQHLHALNTALILGMMIQAKIESQQPAIERELSWFAERGIDLEARVSSYGWLWAYRLR